MSSRSGSRRHSLAARLTLWYAGSAFALVLCASLFLTWALRAILAQEDYQTLDAQIARIESAVRARSTALQDEVDAAWQAHRYLPVMLRVLDAGGRVVGETRGMPQVLGTVDFPAPAPEPIGVDRRVGGRLFRLVSRSVAVDGGPTYLVQAALERSEEEVVLSRFGMRAAATLVVALALSAAIGVLIARRGVRPVIRIAEQLREIRPSRLRERVTVDGAPREIAELADTANEMLARLEDSFARLGRFSADIAHELRTPLNNLRGELEVGLGRARTPDEYRDALGSSLEECARLGRIIDGLLFLARADHPAAQIRRDRVDVTRELEAMREFYDAAASESEVRLDVVADGSVAVEADRTLLQRALGNLIENALAHTPRGGTVRIVAARAGGSVRLQVSDTGPGIPPEHLPHVFERFYRVEQDRSAASGGVGLGMAIVKSIVELHGGKARISSAVGRGTSVELDLPAAN